MGKARVARSARHRVESVTRFCDIESYIWPITSRPSQGSWP